MKLQKALEQSMLPGKACSEVEETKLGFLLAQEVPATQSCGEVAQLLRQCCVFSPNLCPHSVTNIG